MDDDTLCLSAGAGDGSLAAIWPRISAADLEARLEAFGHAPNHDQLESLAAAWSQFSDETRVAERLELHARLALRARHGELSACALLPILLGDHDHRVGSAAALSLAMAHRPDQLDPERGPFFVLKHVLCVRARNAGAALGGLLGLGDAKVAQWIFKLRDLLGHPDMAATLEAMTACRTGFLHKSVVEFYLDWLEELAEDLPASIDTFRCVAKGLTDQRACCAVDFVIDATPRYPAPLEGPSYEDGWRMIPMHEFTRSITPRLEALARAERPCVAMAGVVRGWRLAAR